MRRIRGKFLWALLACTLACASAGCGADDEAKAKAEE